MVGNGVGRGDGELDLDSSDDDDEEDDSLSSDMESGSFRDGSLPSGEAREGEETRVAHQGRQGGQGRHELNMGGKGGRWGNRAAREAREEERLGLGGCGGRVNCQVPVPVPGGCCVFSDECVSDNRVVLVCCCVAPGSGAGPLSLPKAGLPPRAAHLASLGHHHHPWAQRHLHHPPRPYSTKHRGGSSAGVAGRSPTVSMGTSYDPMAMATSYGTMGMSSMGDLTPTGTSPVVVDYPICQSMSPMDVRGMPPQQPSHMNRLAART